MDIQFMRAEIGKVYNNNKWRNKVSSMPARQVIAIYKRMWETGQIEYAAQRRAREAEEQKFHQITLEEYFGKGELYG